MGNRRHTGRAEQRLSAVTNVATRRASSVESARRTASIGFLDSAGSLPHVVKPRILNVDFDVPARAKPQVRGWYRCAKATKRGGTGGEESERLILPAKRGNRVHETLWREGGADR